MFAIKPMLADVFMVELEATLVPNLRSFVDDSICFKQFSQKYEARF